MRSTETQSLDSTPDTAVCSERRLAANCANAQLSTGPTSEAGKAVASLNAVKTGLCGRTLLFADEEEAQAYREHLARYADVADPYGWRVLDSHMKDLEAKTLKNLRLHERRLQRQIKKDKAELNERRNTRLTKEEQERKAEAEAQRCRQQARLRAQRRKARAAAASGTVLLDANGFEFASCSDTWESGKEQSPDRPESPSGIVRDAGAAH